MIDVARVSRDRFQRCYGNINLITKSDEVSGNSFPKHRKSTARKKVKGKSEILQRSIWSQRGKIPKRLLHSGTFVSQQQRLFTARLYSSLRLVKP